MKTGFMDFVATKLIIEHPGQTERWYAEQYLQLGDHLSDATFPIASLANTLAKQVREGKESRIKRIRRGGKYLYYPTSMTNIPEESSEIIAHLSLSEQDTIDISNLVAVGKFADRDNAIKWLIEEGIRINREFLDKVANTLIQIEHLKQEVII